MMRIYPDCYPPSWFDWIAARITCDQCGCRLDRHYRLPRRPCMSCGFCEGFVLIARRVRG